MALGGEQDPSSAQEQIRLKNKRLGLKLVWIVVGSLLFAFALVPIYNVLCTITGLNGKTNTTAALASKAVVDKSRWVTVQFTTSVMPGLGWNFYPKQPSIKLHPGQHVCTIFFCRFIVFKIRLKSSFWRKVAGRAFWLQQRNNICNISCRYNLRRFSNIAFFGTCRKNCNAGNQ